MLPAGTATARWSHGSRTGHLFYSGLDAKGEWFQLFQIGFGGIPGRPLGDGPDGHSLWPNFTNVPNEFLERYFPLRIERYETVRDSGGAGLHRGGNGIDMVYRFLQPGAIFIHDDRWFTMPWGVNGGEPGARARKVLIKSDGRAIVVGARVQDLEVNAGDQLHFVTWGGGGWGDPLARDPALVARRSSLTKWCRAWLPRRARAPMGWWCRRPACATRRPPRP